MKLFRMFLVSALLIFAFAQSASADDFAWARDFNLQAQADPSGFRARLGTRFNIGDLQVSTVISNFDNPSDAYIALRLGEMCDRPVDYVIDRYKRDKGNGWGNLAKSLGIKPGSAEFHALKQGNDLYSSAGGTGLHSSNYSSKGKGNKMKGNGKGKKNKNK